MRIAVLSDTHLASPNHVLVSEFEQVLQPADALLHLGDITSESVLDYLASHRAFYAVAGNMDSGRWAAELPAKRVVELNGLRVGMLHGAGLGFGNLEAALPDRFAQENVQLICFGHTHRRLWQESGGVRLLNPGSFTFPKQGRPGYALVQVTSQGDLEVEWRLLEERI